jgi:hypothetical protein
MEALARGGLASVGVSFVLVAALALELATGHGGAATDREGAMAYVARTPLGEVLLPLVALGFLGYAAWRLALATVGEPVESRRKEDPSQRLRQACLGVFYAALSVATIRLLVRPANPSPQRAHAAEVILRWPGGPVIVGIVGIGFIVASIVNAYRAITGRYRRRLKRWQIPKPEERMINVIAVAGFTARFVIFGLIGAFLIRAAATYDPQDATGMDVALREIAIQPYGRILLAVVALGLLAHGLYRFAESRFRKV